MRHELWSGENRDGDWKLWKKFSAFLVKMEKSSGIWRKIEWRLRTIDNAMCFSMWWQLKFSSPLLSDRFRVRESRGEPILSDIFSCWSRGFSSSLRFLISISLSGWLADSPIFPPIRVEPDKQGFWDGAQEKPLNGTRRGTWFLLRTSSIREREHSWKIRSKRTFGGDFRSNFPDFSDFSPLLGCQGWVGRRLGGPKNRTWSHPSPCADGINKWLSYATSR